MEPEPMQVSNDDHNPAHNDQDGEGGIHPCLIPHVVDKILRSLSHGKFDLCNARMVCKQWTESASKVLRHNSEISVGSFRTNFEKIWEIISQAETESLDFFPIGGFTLCQDVFQPENLPILKNLLLTFSPIMESLKLWMDLKSTLLFNESSFLYHDKRFRNLTFPKMRSIDMDDQRRIDGNFVDTGPRLLDFLIRASPKLESLSIQYMRESLIPGYERPGLVNEMLMELFDRNQNALRNLTSLKLDVHCDDSLLESLSRIFNHDNTRLKTLYLCLRGSNFSGEAFFNFLSSLRHKLESLKITFLSQKSHFTVKFPRMENLKLFEISGWDSTFDNVGFSADISYSSHLPVLKVLHLGSWTNRADWQFLLENQNQSFEPVPILTLEELKLPEEVSKADCMGGIVKMFPNLKKLDVKLSLKEIQVLRIIFENLTQLEDLTVKKSSVFWEREQEKERIDYIFTGIPQTYCDLVEKCNLSRFPVSLPLKGDMVQNVMALKNSVGVENLKNLKRLEISELQYIAEITDVSAYLGFLSLDKLEYLDAGYSGMSNRCMKILANKFPNNMKAQAAIPRLPQSKRKSSSSTGDHDGQFLQLPHRCYYL